MNDVLRRGEDFDRVMNQERLILEITETLCGYMQQHVISRNEVARKLGKDKQYVDRFLNGERELTIRSLADFLGALGARATISLSGPDRS